MIIFLVNIYSNIYQLKNIVDIYLINKEKKLYRKKILSHNTEWPLTNIQK